MREIRIPQINVSDSSCTITTVYKKNGDSVACGDPLFSLETSKDSMDILAEEDGVLSHSVVEGSIVPVGEIVAIIDAKPHATATFTPPNPSATSSVGHSGTGGRPPRITKPAQELMIEKGLSPELFAGLTIVKVGDVEAYLNALTGGGQPVSKRPSNELVIIGGGGHSKVCIDMLRQIGGYRLVGIVDPGLSVGSDVLGIPVLGDDSILDSLYERGIRFAVNAVGAATDPNIRKRIFDSAKKIGYYFTNVIHPRSIIEPTVELGEGNQIMAGACIGSCARLGSNCIVNTGAIVSHDCTIDDHVHLAPAAVLAGTVVVEECSVVGMCASVFWGVHIGKGSVINNGRAIFGNVADGERLK